MERDHHHEAAEEEMRDRVVTKLLMTYSEAVWSIGVCERTLRNYVARGELTAVKIGGRTLFDPVDLSAMIDAHRTNQATVKLARSNGDSTKETGTQEKISQVPVKSQHRNGGSSRN